MGGHWFHNGMVSTQLICRPAFTTLSLCDKESTLCFEVQMTAHIFELANQGTHLREQIMAVTTSAPRCS